MKSFHKIHPLFLWYLRANLILQAAVFTPSLPEYILPFPLNSILLCGLMLCVFALGMCIPWKRKWYMIIDFLIPAGAVFLLPGNALLMLFCAGSLLRMDLQDDSETPFSFRAFICVFCLGTCVSCFLTSIFGCLFYWLIPLVLLIAALFFNYYRFFREKKLVAALSLVAVLASIWFVLPVVAMQDIKETDTVIFEEEISQVELKPIDSEMLPLLALQVFSVDNIYFCGEWGGGSYKIFNTFPLNTYSEPKNIAQTPEPDHGLYYFELPSPKNSAENYYFTRPFYNEILKSAKRPDVLLAVRVPIPRSDPREEQVAAVIAATLPGKVAQIYGPFFRYFVVKKDGSLPDVSPENLATMIEENSRGGTLTVDLAAAGYAALQAINDCSFPEGEKINSREDPQLLSALGVELEPQEKRFNACRIFLTGSFPWLPVGILVIYLLARYFINWSPNHKPVFHFVEKGICCGGVLAVFFTEWWRISVSDKFILMAEFCIILLLLCSILRIKNNIFNALIALCFVLLTPLSFLTTFLMGLLLYFDHTSVRERFFFREEAFPRFYCISGFSCGVAFTVAASILWLFPEHARIINWLFLALMCCHGISSFCITLGKGKKTS